MIKPVRPAALSTLPAASPLLVADVWEVEELPVEEAPVPVVAEPDAVLDPVELPLDVLLLETVEPPWIWGGILVGGDFFALAWKVSTETALL